MFYGKKFGDKMPKISVIIPIYNTEKYLSECLNSVLNQTFEDIEVICIDDGSTDKSLEILNKFAKQDPRIKILKQQNQYAGVARNNGLKIANGDYIFFVDSDDYIIHETLQLLYDKITSTDSDISICRPFEYINETHVIKEILWSLRLDILGDKKSFSYLDFPEQFFQIFEAWPWDKLYKKELLDKFNIRFSELRSCEDVIFVFLAMIHAKKITYIEDFCTYHRIHKYSMDLNRDPFNLFYIYKDIEHELRRIDKYDCLKKSFLNQLCKVSNHHIRIAKPLIKKYKIFKYIKTKLFEDFLIDHIEESYFYKTTEIEKLKLIRNSSFIYFLIDDVCKKLLLTYKLLKKWR